MEHRMWRSIRDEGPNIDHQILDLKRDYKKYCFQSNFLLKKIILNFKYITQITKRKRNTVTIWSI